MKDPVFSNPSGHCELLLLLVLAQPPSFLPLSLTSLCLVNFHPLPRPLFQFVFHALGLPRFLLLC